MLSTHLVLRFYLDSFFNKKMISIYYTCLYNLVIVIVSDYLFMRFDFEILYLRTILKKRTEKKFVCCKMFLGGHCSRP